MDGSVYRWHVSPKKVDDGGALATVQTSQGGAALHYWLEDFPDPDEAARVILFALSNGWKPLKSRTAVWVERTESGLALGHERRSRHG